jgi:hypothetical protein
LTPNWPFGGIFSGPLLLDDDDNDNKPKIPGTQMGSQPSDRYFFGLLDSRSSYGNDFFPDPFLGPEFDKDSEIEVDYLHGESHNLQSNEVDTELEWNPIGQLTVSGELGWESDHQTARVGSAPANDVDQENANGIENVDLAVFHPIFQYLTGDGAFDYTAVARMDVGIPTRTPVSGTDLQLTPYIGQLLRIGDHVSIEAWTGSQITIAPDQTDQFIYGALFGYQISHDQIPLPLTDAVTPIFELDGQTPLSSLPQDALFGVAGLNWELTAIHDLQPRIGIGYEFPIDQGARDQLRWGIITQAFFEF